MSLPASTYEADILLKVTIQPDYLATVGNYKCLAPYKFVGKKVEIQTTEKSIEVFFHNQRTDSYVRRENSHEPIYILQHMPENHRKLLEYDSEHFIE